MTKTSVSLRPFLRSRGYLLMEVSIAAAITSVAVLGLVSLLSDAQVTSTASSRDVTAQGLLRREVERVRSLKFGTIAVQPATPVTGLMGTYKIQLDVGTATETLIAGETTNFKDVTITVTHPERGKVRTHTTMVRVYE
jgi:Tfp pilus assembly protein PilV